jgi:hypothetical protein
MRYFLAFALVLSACGKKDDKPAAQGTDEAEKVVKALDNIEAKHKNKKPTGTPHPQEKLTVTYDGKPLGIATALAFRRPDGTIDITASSVPLGCAEITGDMRTIYDGEVYFNVMTGQSLMPDGKMQPVIKQWSIGSTTTANLMPTTGTGDGSPGKSTTVDLDLTGKDSGMRGTPHQITIKGTVDALGCEPPPAKEAVALPPEMPATIEIAGKKLPIRSAVFSMSGDWPSLELRTGGETCARKSGEKHSEFDVSLTWFKKGDPNVSQVSLGGEILPNKMDQTFDKKKLVVKPTPSGPGEIEIHGDIKVMDYPVKIDGKVTAVVCAK